MIEFKGKISGKTLKFQAKRYKIALSISFLIAALFICVLYRAYSMFVPVGFIILVLLLCPSKAFVFLTPKRVYIDLEDRTIVSVNSESSEVFRMIDDIVEVKDYGEFYTFKFNSQRAFITFIAQKDLITHGTIEEFEEIFEEVMVRVHK